MMCYDAVEVPQFINEHDLRKMILLDDVARSGRTPRESQTSSDIEENINIIVDTYSHNTVNSAQGITRNKKEMKERTSKSLLTWTLRKNGNVRQRMYALIVLDWQGPFDEKPRHGIFRIDDIVVFLYRSVDGRLSWTGFVNPVVLAVVGVRADGGEECVSECAQGQQDISNF